MTVDDILEPIPDAAIHARISPIFTPIANVFAAIDAILTPVQHVLEPIDWSPLWSAGERQ